MALSQKQISELNAAALKPDKTATDLANLEYAANTFGYSAPTSPEQIEETQESVDNKYAEAAANNPVIADLTSGGSSVEEIIHALSTGDLTGIVDWQGQPFSVADQQAALTQATEDNRLYYEALQTKETADTEAALAKSQADYQDYLINAGQSFEADKTKSDQQSADKGVLFSGGRVQREKNLQRAYEQDQATKFRQVGGAIGTEARDFQYKYGGEAAGELSSFYNLPKNVYNPNVATGGVSQSGLSSVYSPSKFGFQGTRNVEQSAAAQQRAAGFLWNKGNKLLATGYKNQF